jgi:hypothetical protein
MAGQQTRTIHLLQYSDKEVIMKKIIYTTETGVCVLHPTGELSIEAVLAKDVPIQYRSTARIVDNKEIPTDRYFRDAWEIKNEKIVENIDKAKEIHKNKLRADRVALLEGQDVLYMKALEDGADTKAIVAEKKRLRDITKEVDKAATIAEIKAVKIK